MSRYLFAFRNIASESRLRFLPVMITRLLLSLKKVGAPQEDGWSFGESITYTTMNFAEPRGGAAGRDEVPLDTFASTQEGTQSHELDVAVDLTPFLHRKLGDLAT